MKYKVRNIGNEPIVVQTKAGDKIVHAKSDMVMFASEENIKKAVADANNNLVVVVIDEVKVGKAGNKMAMPNKNKHNNT